MVCKMFPRMRTILLATVFVLALYGPDVQGGPLVGSLTGALTETVDQVVDTILKVDRWLEKQRNTIEAEKLRRKRLEEAKDVIVYGKTDRDSDTPVAEDMARDPRKESEDTFPAAELSHTTQDRSSPTPRNAEKWREGRVKRSVHYADSNSWPQKIPYVISDDWKAVANGYYVPILKRVFKWYEERLCVTFHDETDNVNTPMTQLGYEYDAYLNFINGNGCFAFDGRNGKTGPVNISPCFGFLIMTHEVGHTLGVSHMQDIPTRNKYVVTNPGNIDPSMLGSYEMKTADKYYTMYFDRYSTMMYTPLTWDVNGMETYTYMRWDDMESETGVSREETIIRELNKIFRCNELYCNNSTTDCGPGYYALRNGACGCVCPRFYDPATNCQTMIDKPSSVGWPNVPLVLPKGGKNTPCPAGFTPGGYTQDGRWAALQLALPDLYNASGTTTYFETCSKPGPSQVDWEVMPTGGSYCIIKPVGAQCGFGQATLQFTSLSNVQSYGNIGDITINGANITMKLCCSYQAPPDMVIDLPNKEPFRLIAKGTCPIVRGMRSYKAMVSYYTTSKTVSGDVQPQYYIFDKELQTFHCFYKPPVYGCHQEVTLSATNRKVTIKTPGYDSSAREPNRRCFYIFYAPEKAQLLLTLVDYDLDVDDKVLVQLSHMLEEQKRVDNINYPKQIVSEANSLTVEYWAGYTAVSNKGVKLTVEVILAEDSCYDVSQNGGNYLGDTSISETFEKCIPWAEAANCDGFPWDSEMLPELIGGSASCRNPNGDLLGPWCYTYVNDTVCQQRYCDVCNYKAPADVLRTSNCSQLMAADPDFCNSALQRFGCFQSCGFQQNTYTPGTCGKPTIPSDGKPKEPLKSSYKEGEKVVILCNSSNFNPSSEEIVCRKDGWTQLNYVCNECPPGWFTYEDRCFRIEVDKVETFDNAAAACRSQGPSGTLFRIYDEDDQIAFKKFRAAIGSPYTGSVTVSGNLTKTIPNQVIGNWSFTDAENLVMQYFNWSVSQNPNSENKRCIRIWAQYATDADGWRAMKCGNESGTERYACQLDRINHGCLDKINFCDSILTAYPDFCVDMDSADLAERVCYKSCGFCEANNQCKEPTNLFSTYSRTSADSTIYPGEVMTFKCNAGRYYVGGDLKRACSASGQLLGKEPDCRTSPVAAVDVNRRRLRPRRDKLPKQKAYLLDQEGYSIPFDGKISKWYYYCYSVGDIYALVYRKSGSSYSYIGSNTISCLARWPWSQNVPTADQISVKEGDIVGFFSTTKDTLYVSQCDGAPNQLLITRRASATDFNAVMSASFTEKECLIPSFGYQVTPQQDTILG